MDQGFQKTVLANGVRVLTQKIPHVRTVSMGVWVNVGARDEKQTENGISHFIEHMIFKGTRKRTAGQIAREFDAIGGHTNAFTAMELTCYYAKVMDAQLETMVDILSDIFLNSKFDRDEVEKERPIILQEIGMVEDSPEEYLQILSTNNCWGNHPLGRSILGCRDNVVRFEAATMRRFFQNFYQPDQILVAAAGNLDHDHFIRLIGPAFETIQARHHLSARLPPLGRRAISATYRDLEQIHISIETDGLSLVDPRRYILSLLNTILGGNMSSRLFQEIRENQGLAYSVYSFTQTHVDAGTFGIYMGVSPDKVGDAVPMALGELEKIRRHPVHPEEIRAAAQYLKGNILLAADSVDNQMVRLAQNELYFGRPIPLQEILTQIDAVTPEAISELAGDLIDLNRLSLTTLGPIEDPVLFEKLLANL